MKRHSLSAFLSGRRPSEAVLITMFVDCRVLIKHMYMHRYIQNAIPNGVGNVSDRSYLGENYCFM